MLNSLVVIGPLLIITGLSFHLFRENRRSTYLYLLTGMACTVIGGVCMIGEFKKERSVRDFQEQQIGNLRAEPARK
jgi:hypothetical protein